MVGSALKEQGGTDTDEDRQGDAPVDGGNQLVAAALAQIRKADGDNQKRLESFAEGDDKRLKHACNPPK